ncbi:MAG: SAM-dependent methyltransferase [Planctomycetota bacterium]|jgi:SAM-dependent methyltransferase
MTLDPWYVTAFGDDYREVYPHRDLETARQEVAWILKQGIGGRVLDLCCGFGRHSLALARAEIDVFGIDLSADLLQHSRKLPDASLLAGRLACADARSLPFGDASFDGFVNLFTSFGYFGEEGDRQVMQEMARVLRPGGLALIDLMNPTRIRANLVPESLAERDGMQLRESRALEENGKRVTKEVEITFADGRVRAWREDVRMFEPEEIDRDLAQCGLDRVARYGSFAGEDFGDDSERQLILLRKR